MGTQLPPRKGAEQHPHFLAHVCCGETVAHLSYCWALVDLFHVNLNGLLRSIIVGWNVDGIFCFLSVCRNVMCLEYFIVHWLVFVAFSLCTEFGMCVPIFVHILRFRGQMGQDLVHRQTWLRCFVDKHSISLGKNRIKRWVLESENGQNLWTGIMCSLCPPKITTATTILQPLHRTTCVSRHPQLRTGGVC